MPKFAANLSLMFPELEPAQRFQAARSADFTAVEYLRPYEFPLKDVRQWREDAGVELILLNSPAGNTQAGERGLGALSGRQADFRESLEMTLDYANGLGARMVHLMAGVVAEGLRRVSKDRHYWRRPRLRRSTVSLSSGACPA